MGKKAALKKKSASQGKKKPVEAPQEEVAEHSEQSEVVVSDTDPAQKKQSSISSKTKKSRSRSRSSSSEGEEDSQMKPPSQPPPKRKKIHGSSTSTSTSTSRSRSRSRSSSPERDDRDERDDQDDQDGNQDGSDEEESQGKKKRKKRGETVSLTEEQEMNVIEWLKDKEQRFLFDKHERDYIDTSKKQKKWEEKATEMEIPLEKLMTWYESIRTRYGKLTKEVDKEAKSGAGAPKRKTARAEWILSNLAFLKEHINRQPSRQSCSVSNQFYIIVTPCQISNDIFKLKT